MNIKYIYNLLIIFMIIPISYCQSPSAEAKQLNIPSKQTIKNAKAMIKNHKFNKALALLSKVPKNNRNYKINSLMAKSLFYLGKYEKALVHLKKAIKSIKQNNKNYIQEKAKLHSLVGYIYQRLGNLDLALKNHKITTNLLKDNVIAWTNLGSIYLKRKEYPNAINAFKKAYNINPNHQSVVFGLANSYHHIKNYNKAIKLFNKLINTNPYSHRGYIGLAKTLMKINKKTKGYTMFAKGYFLERSYPKAIENLKKIKSFRKNKSLLKLYLAILIENATYDKAENEAKIAINRYPKESEFVYDLSQIHLRQKQYKNALKISLSGIKIFPNNHPLHVVAANSYSKLKKSELAIKYFEKSLALEPKDVNSRELLAQLYRVKKSKDLEYFHQGVVYYYVNDLYQAKEVLSWISNINKKAELKYYKGMIYTKLNKINDAIKYLNEAIKENQSLYLPYIALANIYKSNKQKYKSITLLKQYINKYPNSVHIKKVRSYYRQLISK